MAICRTAAAAALRKNVCTQCRNTMAARSSFHFTRSALPMTIRPAYVSMRWHSAPANSPKVYDFTRIKEISEDPSPDRVLIDVREPAEYEAGYIPTAMNLPIKSQPDAIFLPEDEFEDRFGFEKPGTEKEVIFYCRSGVRSSAAAHLAQQHGYKNIVEYRGSWLDWERNGGAAGKS